MTTGAYQDYRAWRSIDYCPSITEFLPVDLLPYIQDNQRILEVGCGKGHVAVWLAGKGFSVSGIDINPTAISSAKKTATIAGVGANVDFKCANFLEMDVAESSLDVILLIRFLTCFPDFADWKAVLKKAHTTLVQNGIIYIHDFVMDSRLPAYQERYRLGQALKWRTGNFAVNDQEGHLQFIAHHHTREELKYLQEPYQSVYCREHQSLSMNNNKCLMFKFIGEKHE